MSIFTHRIRRFIRHCIEMVAIMFAGMIVLGIPGEGLLAAIGSSSTVLQEDAPAVSLLVMATIMTGPVVAWIRRMGHGWRPYIEMAASMHVPTFGAIALVAAGAFDFMTVMMWEHVAMLLSMLLVVLVRREEYSRHLHRYGAIGIVRVLSPIA